MSRTFACLLLVVSAVTIGGCAHPITLSPSLTDLEARSNQQRLKPTIGYFFTENRTKSVTTSGGGGDDVTYEPYEDLETGIYKVLTNVFERVEVAEARSAEALNEKGIDYLLGFTINTSSYSGSAFTWPPTDFEVNLSCQITDHSGSIIDLVRVSGKGHAEWSEFNSDFSLSAKRASTEALLQLQDALILNDSFSSATPTEQIESPAGLSTRDRLLQLRKMFDDGLISQSVFEERQRKILQDN